MADDDRPAETLAEVARLTQELAEAELFAQRLTAYIAEIRDEVAAGHIGQALSTCNRALTESDNATDVAAPSPEQKEEPVGGPPPSHRGDPD